MFSFNFLPQLAVGAHEEGSGSACIMNALSYLTGEREISDTPDCVWKPLAYLAQAYNDGICDASHVGWRSESVPKVICSYSDHPADTDCEDACVCVEVTSYLCPSCTHKMWMFGARTLGTGFLNNLPSTSPLLQELFWQLAELCAEQVDTASCPAKMTVPSYRARLVQVGCDTANQELLGRLVDCHTSCGENHDNMRIFVRVVQDAARFSYRHEAVFSSVFRTGLNFANDSTEFMNKFMDVLEQVTGFHAIPPTEQEIEAARERAGLVSV